MRRLLVVLVLGPLVAVVALGLSLSAARGEGRAA